MQLSKYSDSNHSLKKIIPVLITIVFFLVTSYIAAFHHNYWILDHDGQIYLDVGKQILSGNGNNVKLHNALVGGPVFYAFVDQFFNNGFGVMKSIAVLSATGSVFFSYYIIKNIFNRKVALIGQLFFAFNPWLGFFSFQAENELLPILFISVSLYLVTKKEIKSFDMILIGLFLGLATSIRLQALIVLFSTFIYALFYFRKPRRISYHLLLLSFAFLITLSPVIFYNYTTHESIFDTNAAWSMQFHNKYQYPEWSEKMHEINFYNGSTIDAIFVDPDLFFQNYSYNLFSEMPNRLLNFSYDNINSSILNSIPILGFIPIVGSFVYLFKIKPNRNNLILLFSSSIFTTSLVVAFGDIFLHFFAIIAAPMFLLGLYNIRNVQTNALPLLFLPIIFLLMMSVLLIRAGEHFFVIWFSLSMFAGVFFGSVLPTIFKKLQELRFKSNTKAISISVTMIITIVLLTNFGYTYILYNSTHSDIPFTNIQDEFSNLFKERNYELVGEEIKILGDFIQSQPNIKNSYVMVPHHHYFHYVDTKTVYGQFSEGPSNDTLQNYVTRVNWKEVEIIHSNMLSHPIDRQNIYQPKPDYLIYEFDPPTGRYHHEFIEILKNPNNPDIPVNFENIYYSDKTGIVFAIYKITYDDST